MAQARAPASRGSARRVGVALLAGFAATVGLESASLAGGFSPEQVLRSAPTGDDLFVEDIAGRADDLVVGWVEGTAGTRRTYVRWSRDGGASWGAVKPLLTATHHDPYGIRVEVCGPFAWAVQHEADPSAGKGDAPVPVLHRTHMDTGAHAAWALLGTYTRGVDIACGGERFVATVYVEWSIHSGSLTLWLNVRSVVPGEFPTRTFLVGRSETPSQGLAVSATNGAIQVAWVRDDRIRYRRFTVADDVDATIARHPVVTAVHLTGPGPWGGSPLLAAYGSRVVLGYRDNGGGARVRLSDDGVTFGPPVLSGPDTQAGWVPRSLDMKGNRILFEVQEVTCCPNDTAHPLGLLSTNLGGSWNPTTTRAYQGVQMGALFTSLGVRRVGEAWDRSLEPTVPHQKLRFHHGPN